MVVIFFVCIGGCGVLFLFNKVLFILNLFVQRIDNFINKCIMFRDCLFIDILYDLFVVFIFSSFFKIDLLCEFYVRYNICEIKIM